MVIPKGTQCPVCKAYVVTYDESCMTEDEILGTHVCFHAPSSLLAIVGWGIPALGLLMVLLQCVQSH